MIQPNDFKEKQIFCLDASSFKECNIKLNNENILVLKNNKNYSKVPIHRLLIVFIIGDITITSKLIQKLVRTGASIFLLRNNLECYASIQSYAEGNYLLRQKQYNLSEDKCLFIAKKIVENKLINQLSLLRGANIQEIGGKKRMVYKSIMTKKIRGAKNKESLRGLEGSMSKECFRAYFSRISWYRRIPRGKNDENNILLDMGYSYLFNFVDSLLRVYGFDTYKGIYHQLYFQRKSFSCDMMEPFRCVIDKALVKLHKLNIFDEKDFGHRKGQYYLSYKKSSKYIKFFMKEVLGQKENIYNYIRAHYYFILNEEGEIKNFIIR